MCAEQWERKFLGFSFRMGKRVYRVIAPVPVREFKAKVRAMTRRTRGVTLERMVTDLRRYLTGWRGYFGFAQEPSLLRGLDEWIRRRVRCFMWKQWKYGKNRYHELRKRGVSPHLAAKAAGSPHGPWRLSCSPALNKAFPIRFFEAIGIPSLQQQSPAN